jgi:hypothetical protein
MDFFHRELLLKELKSIINGGGDIRRVKMIQKRLKEE